MAAKTVTFRFIWKLLIVELSSIFLGFEVFGDNDVSRLMSKIILIGNPNNNTTNKSSHQLEDDHTKEGTTWMFTFSNYSYETEKSLSGPQSTLMSTNLVSHHHHQSSNIYIITIIGLVALLIILLASTILIIRFKKRKYIVDKENAHPSGITDLGLRNISLTRRNIDSSSFSAGNRSDSDSMRGIELYELNGSVSDALCGDDTRLFNLFYERDDVFSPINEGSEIMDQNKHLCACSENYLYLPENDIDLENRDGDNFHIETRMRRSRLDRNNGYVMSNLESRRNRGFYGRHNAAISMDESLLINSYRKIYARCTNNCLSHLDVVRKESSNEICKVNIELNSEDMTSLGAILYIKESISTERLSKISFYKRETSLLEEVMGELARRSVIMNLPGLAETNIPSCELVPYSQQTPVRDDTVRDKNLEGD